jgi:hypothetical protein
VEYCAFIVKRRVERVYFAPFYANVCKQQGNGLRAGLFRGTGQAGNLRMYLPGTARRVGERCFSALSKRPEKIRRERIGMTMKIMVECYKRIRNRSRGVTVTVLQKNF